MTLLWRLAMCLMAMSTLSTAQDRAFIRLGPVLGYRNVDAVFTTTALEGERTSNSPATLATFAGFTLGALSPLTETFSLRLDIESMWGWGGTSTFRGETFIQDGEPISGTIRTDHDITTAWSVIDAGVSWMVSPRVNIDLVAGAQIVSSLDGTWSETIESPSGASFVSSGSPTRTFPNVSSAGRTGTVSLITGFDVGTTIPVASKINVMPALRFRYTVTEAMEGSSWHPFDLALGVTVAFATTPHKPRPAPASVSQTAAIISTQTTVPDDVYAQRFAPSDTVTIIDAFVPGRVDTLWSSRLTQRIDTVRGPIADTILTTITTVVERHLPGPLPFLSTILDVVIDQNTADTMTMVRISAEIESEATTTTELRAVVDSVVTWSSVNLAKSIKHIVPLTAVVPDVRNRRTMSIEVQAITTDAYGQKKEAVPKRFVLKRLPASGRLQQQ